MLTSVRNYIRDYIAKDHYLLFVNELERLVKANQLGLKSNTGFYTYPVEDQQEDILVSLRQDLIDSSVKRLQSTLALSLKRFSSRSGIDLAILNDAMKEYLGTDKNLPAFLN
jgi:3-hydroxyacyl-CoA dehydrogenase